MKYLSKGLPFRRSGETLIISHCGKEYELTGERASIWENGRCGFDAALSGSQYTALQELAGQGLAETSVDADTDSLFRLLVNCVICPINDKALAILWNPLERRLWIWLTKAGLRLTIAELVFLIEKDIKPASKLLGDENRQALTETIYTTETIPDGILESRMEQSPARDRTVRAISNLLRKNRIFLI